MIPRAALALALAACGGAAKPATGPAPAAAPTGATAGAEPAVPAPTPPPGYVPMRAAGVINVGDGAEAVQAVGLVDEQGTIVPIFIGGTEATTIAFRLNDQPFLRPLTHDLLDAVLEAFGGRVYKVQVDDLVDGTFLGSVYVIKAGRVIRLDARPSDAIAIAVGHSVPIYVASKVIEAAGQRGEPPAGGGGKVVPRSP